MASILLNFSQKQSNETNWLGSKSGNLCRFTDPTSTSIHEQRFGWGRAHTRKDNLWRALKENLWSNHKARDAESNTQCYLGICARVGLFELFLSHGWGLNHLLRSWCCFCSCFCPKIAFLISLSWLWSFLTLNMLEDGIEVLQAHSPVRILDESSTTTSQHPNTK